MSRKQSHHNVNDRNDTNGMNISRSGSEEHPDLLRVINRSESEERSDQIREEVRVTTPGPLMHHSPGKQVVE